MKNLEGVELVESLLLLVLAGRLLVSVVLAAIALLVGCGCGGGSSRDLSGSLLHVVDLGGRISRLVDRRQRFGVYRRADGLQTAIVGNCRRYWRTVPSAWRKPATGGIGRWIRGRRGSS